VKGAEGLPMQVRAPLPYSSSFWAFCEAASHDDGALLSHVVQYRHGPSLTPRFRITKPRDAHVAVVVVYQNC